MAKIIAIAKPKLKSHAIKSITGALPLMSDRKTAVIKQKPNNYVNHVFENIEFVGVCYRSTRKQLNQIFFGFAMNLSTWRKLIITSRLLIRSFT